MRVVPKPENVCVCKVGRLGAKDVWVAGGTGGIEGTWSFYSQSDETSRYEYTTSGVFFSDLAVLSDREVLAAGSINPDKEPKSAGIVLYTTNGGRSWSTVFQSDKSKSITAMDASDPTHIWAVGKNGVILEIKRF